MDYDSAKGARMTSNYFAIYRPINSIGKKISVSILVPYRAIFEKPLVQKIFFFGRNISQTHSQSDPIVTPPRKLFKNYITMFAGNIIGQLFFFFGLAYLARVLGPSEFGVWNFAQVCMLYILRGSEFGMESIGIRETSRSPKSTATWIANIVSLRLILGSFFFCLALILSFTNLLPSGTTSLVLISALSVFPMAFLLEWVFEARQEVGLISIARILKGLLFFLGVILMVSTSKDIEKAAYLYVGCLTFSGMMVLSFALSRFGFNWSSLNLRGCLDVFKKTLPIGIASLLSQYSLFVATMLVGYFNSKEELGYFTAANRIVIFLWAYIISSMHRILLPSLSKSFLLSLSHFQRFVEKFFRLSTLVVVPIGLVGTLCSTQLMTLLYSSRYKDSGVVFGILLWGFVLANIRSILEIALIASDRQKQFMKGMIILSVIYTVVTSILTLQFGIIGTAVAVVVSELSYFSYLISSCPFSKPKFLLMNSWKPLIAAIVALVPLIVLSDLHVLLRMIVGLSVFAAMVLILKGVTTDDYEVVKTLFRRNDLQTQSETKC
jgi:O-antigen/teichoic acid export membrane protein